MNAGDKFGKGGDFALLLSAVIKKESSFGAGLPGSPSAGDGLMQVEPNTRNAYLSQFSSKFVPAYNHGSEQDQVYLGALILNEKIIITAYYTITEEITGIRELQILMAVLFWPINMQMQFTLLIRAMAVRTKVDFKKR